jgi:hypothetical protein
VIAGWVSVTIAGEATGEKLVRDDYVFAGADGVLIRQTDGGQVHQTDAGQVQAGTDKWLFEFESEAEGGREDEVAGRTFEILSSGTLEKLKADAKERVDARYRLWGKVTKFEGKNYIFPTYFVGLKKIDRPGFAELRRGEPASRPQQQGSSKKAMSVNASNDVLNIPDEIVSKLQTSEVLPAEETPVTQEAQLQLKQDTIFANRTGFVAAKGGQYFFEPDGLGRGLEKVSLELLPCQKLEEATAQMRGSPNPVRFNVAGVLTRYNDKQYLLLQKLTRAYSYGNFGR